MWGVAKKSVFSQPTQGRKPGVSGLVSITSCWANNIYQHQLPEIHSELTITAEFLHFHNILTDIARSPSTDDYHPRGKAAKAAQGEEAKARLQSWHASEATEAAPRTMSLINWMDEVRLQVATNNILKDSYILHFTETWLH